jgi:hypothetical protein
MVIFVRLSCVYVVLCIGKVFLLANPPSKQSYRLCIGSRNWKAAKAQQRAVQP